MKTCKICAYPDRCEEAKLCFFEKNWKRAPDDLTAKEHQDHIEWLKKRAIASLEAALRKLKGLG